jgi:hypothetical protein
MEQTSESVNIVETIMCSKDSESLLTGAVGSKGGVYQSFSKGSVEKMCAALRNFYDVSEKSVFMDIGCGQNRICWLVAQLLQIRAIGIEICPSRALAASLAALNLLNAERKPRNNNVCLLRQDAAVKDDWTGVDVFFVWDTAFTDDVATCIFDNINQAIPAGEECLLITSLSHRKRNTTRDSVFYVTQVGPKVKMMFKGSTSTTTLQLFKVKRKTELIQKRFQSRLLDRAECFFRSEDIQMSYKNLIFAIKKMENASKPPSVLKRSSPLRHPSNSKNDGLA